MLTLNMEIYEIEEFKLTPLISEKLISYGISKTFAEGDIILGENSYIRSIPIVITGSIRVMRRDKEGREILLYYIKPGESCIMSLSGGFHHDISKIEAIAEEETSVLFIPVDKIQTLIKEYPELLDYIFRLYHNRFEELIEVINAIAFTKLDERLLNLIMKKSELVKSDMLHITHEQLANELGTARVVVSRLLKKMEENGLITMGRNKISLV